MALTPVSKSDTVRKLNAIAFFKMIKINFLKKSLHLYHLTLHALTMYFRKKRLKKIIAKRRAIHLKMRRVCHRRALQEYQVEKIQRLIASLQLKKTEENAKQNLIKYSEKMKGFYIQRKLEKHTAPYKITVSTDYNRTSVFDTMR